MLVAFGAGIVIGILIVITGLKIAMNTEPEGCILFFGLLFSMFLGLITIILNSDWVG